MPGPDYPNQQLRAVGLETYFRGRVGFRAAAERIQRQFEDQFPHLFVPNVTDAGRAPDLQPYQLRDEANTEALGLAVNQASYVTFKYPGHKDFLARALDLLPTALAEFGVTRLERVIYRYENELDLGRDEKGTIPIHLVLRTTGHPWWENSRLSAFSCSWTQLTTDGRLEIGVVVENQGTASETLRISISSVVSPAGGIGDLPEFARRAHDEARTWFESAITDEFRRYIRGEPGEEATARNEPP